MAVCYSCMREVPDGERVCPHCSHAVPYIPSNNKDLKPGFELYNGRFIVGRALGHGGFGITYIAFDRRLRTVRTIKEYYPRDCDRGPNGSIIIPPDKQEMAEKNRQNFLHEAQMMTIASDAHIDHIVSVIDQFNENNTSYILMEYLDGKTIDDYMRDVLHKPFPWKDAVRLVAETLGALHKLHQHHILHRDISCNNIFLLKNGSPCLIDFGSAETTEDALKRPEQIRHSQKPAYTPREQAENKPQGPFSDVYAMAVVLFKMIAGNVDRNLKGQALPSIKAVTGNKSIPVELDRILADASNPNPAQRIQTAEEFQKRLNKLIGVKKQGGMTTGAKVGLALFVAAVLGVGAWFVLTQSSSDINTKFTAPTLAYQDTANVTGNTLTVTDDGYVKISGTAEAGEKMILKVSSPSGEEYIRKEFEASGGKWSQEINSAELDTPINQSRRYVISIAYQDENGTPAESDLILEVDRRFQEISFSYDETEENSLDVTRGHLVTVSGTAQQDQYVVVTLRESGKEIIADERRAEGGLWNWSLDTSILEIGAGRTAAYDINVGYRDVKLNAGNTLRLNVTAPQENLTIGFAGTEEKEILITSVDEEVRITGTATPNENLRLTVGDKVFFVRVEESGSWLRTVKPAELDLTYNELRTYEVQAAYSGAADAGGSEILKLNIRLKAEEIKIPPTLTWSDGTKDRKDVTALTDVLSFAGTADVGARLVLRADGVKVGETTADAEGNWTLSVGADAFGVGPGQQKDIRLDAAEAEDESNNSQYIQARFNIPKVLAPLTIGFEGIAEKEYTIRRDGEARLNGTGEPGETLLLRIDTETRNVTVGEDGNWFESIAGNRYSVELGETITKSIQAVYFRDESLASEALTLHIEYPRFTAPTILFYGVDETRQTEPQKLGPMESISVYGMAEAGQTLELYLDGAAWVKAVAVSENGSWSETISVPEMSANSMLDTLLVKARYQDQPTVTSENTLIISVDRYADPITVDQDRLDDETTEITGRAESGASLALTDAAGSVLSETKVARDGTFGFIGVTLQGNSNITIAETDIYGNKSELTLPVYMTERMLIEPESTYSPHGSTVYGTGTRPTQIRGTAHPLKPLTVTQVVNGVQTAQQTVEVDENGNWSMDPNLPSIHEAFTQLTFAYADGKGISVELKFVADYVAEDISLPYTEIVQTATNITVTIPSGGTVRINGGKEYADTDGDGKVNMALPPLEGVGQLTFTATDIYGNQTNPVSVSVKSLRTKVTGWFERLEDGTKYKPDDTIGFFAYVVAGEDAVVEKARIDVAGVDTANRGSVYSQRGSMMDVDQLEFLAEAPEAAGAQLDVGWRISVKDMDKSQLEPGKTYEVSVIADVSGESMVLSKVSFIYEEAETSNGLYIENDQEGWHWGLDLDNKQTAYHSNSIWFTGYYYADSALGAVTNSTLYLYSDAQCQDLVESKAFGLNKGKSLLPRNKDTAQIQALMDAGLTGSGTVNTDTSGVILLFKVGDKKLFSSGETEKTFYAKLEITADQTFEVGPIQITVSKNADQMTLKSITNDYAADWWIP